MPQFSSTGSESFDETLDPSGRQHNDEQSSTPIHKLNDDSLLNVFHLCRPNIFDEHQDRDNRVIKGGGWGRECWWYRPVQVCRRWRQLILASALYLRLRLVCTHGTPVKRMLAHFHHFPLPLVIDLDDTNQCLTAEDEEGITFALQLRDRVRCIHLEAPVPSLVKLVTSMDGEFPMLEYMHIAPPTKHNIQLALPLTFEAPLLRHLVLHHMSSPIGLPFLTNATGLVTLLLRLIHSPTYPRPDQLLEALSHLPQLQTLQIGFLSPLPNHDITMELLRQPFPLTPVTFPHLRWFAFAGVSAFLEALLPHMITPLLETFKVHFFNQLSYDVPNLLRFITITQNLRFATARFCFYDGGVAVWIYPDSETTMVAFYVHVLCKHFDWQVSSMAEILSVLEPAFSQVAALTLDCTERSLMSGWHNQASPTLWQRLLGSFRGIEALGVQEGLVEELSRSLRLDNGSPPEILSGLKELVCPNKSRGDEIFATFIRERRVAGRPVVLISPPFPEPMHGPMSGEEKVFGNSGFFSTSFLSHRILLAGRAGTGKSSIINHVLRIGGQGAAVVKDWKVGDADIKKAFTSNENKSVLLHDSQGFESGDTTTYNIVRDFIKERSHGDYHHKDRLHAVWLCAEIPRSGGRVVEEGDLKLLRLAHDTKTPVLIIFTKYDLVIRSEKDWLQEDGVSYDLDTRSRGDAQQALDKCVQSLQNMLNKMNRHSERADERPIRIMMPHFVNVSVHPQYWKETETSSLTQVTQALVRRRFEPRDWPRTLVVSIG